MSTPGSAIDTSCKHPAGAYAPVIDRNRCEGKAECVAVCPMQVFEIARLPEAERAGLSMKGRIKGFVHGWKQATMPNIAACEGCALCVTACPERAITLKKV